MAIYRERAVVGAIAGGCVDAVANRGARLENPLAYLTFYSFGNVELWIGVVFVEKLVGKTIKIFSCNSELRFSINGNVVL